jgi:quercetin dioxygenase-like cupin family protein
MIQAQESNDHAGVPGSGRELIDMVGSRFELVSSMGDSENDSVIFRTKMAAGKSVPLHGHSDPECFYVLSGNLGVFLDDGSKTWRTIGTGSSILEANGVRHAIRTPAEAGADLVMITNNRFARFLRDAGRRVSPETPFRPPTAEDIERMIRASAAYGYWNASPAESAAITGRS